MVNEKLYNFLQANKGKRFKFEPGIKKYYKNAEGKTILMEVLPSQDPEKLKEMIKQYIDEHRSLTSKIAQVEFSDDYTEIKIYENGRNFFYGLNPKI